MPYLNPQSGELPTGSHGQTVVAMCDRCGAGLAYPYDFNGKVYGSECILKATGFKLDRWVVRDTEGRKVIDIQATEAQEAARARRVAEEDARRQAEAQEAERLAAESKAANGWILDFLEGEYPGDFVRGMVEHLSRRPAKELRPRALWILAEMYGKTFGGRRGSKKYDAAETDFFRKLGFWPDGEKFEEEGA